MLPKDNRLTQKKDIDFVFKNGKTTKSDFLIFKFLKNHLNKTRVGFIVSKKVSNKSTKRNLIKRRLRKAVLDNFKDINSEKKQVSLDVLIITLPEILNKNFPEIKNIVSGFFKNK